MSTRRPRPASPAPDPYTTPYVMDPEETTPHVIDPRTVPKTDTILRFSPSEEAAYLEAAKRMVERAPGGRQQLKQKRPRRKKSKRRSKSKNTSRRHSRSKSRR